MKTVVLINVGTPDAPDAESVGVYLREFLMDENILPIPRPFRDILVKGLIVPRRRWSSAEKYQSIWSVEGSPLMKHSRDLQQGLQKSLGEGWRVVLGMQVGNPSLGEALEKAAPDSDEIFILPLYPQFSTATTGGALKMVQAKLGNRKSVQVLKHFYQSEWFLKSQAQRIKQSLKPQDHLLLSYHGLPVSMLQKHRPQCGERPDCCLQARSCLENCYKAQCLATSQLLQKELGLEKISIGFQSRLGRARWIEPSTISVVQKLAAEGVKHLKVACPSFVADCLETLEEIGVELRAEFLKAGGESFELIECLNGDETFVQGLAFALKTDMRSISAPL
jgi:ferrochelatase